MSGISCACQLKIIKMSHHPPAAAAAGAQSLVAEMLIPEASVNDHEGVLCSSA